MSYTQYRHFLERPRIYDSDVVEPVTQEDSSG